MYYVLASCWVNIQGVKGPKPSLLLCRLRLLRSLSLCYFDVGLFGDVGLLDMFFFAFLKSIKLKLVLYVGKE